MSRMTVVICPECGDKGNLSHDKNDEETTKYYKIQHSYNQGKQKGQISYCYLGKEENIDWSEIREPKLTAGEPIKT